MEDIVTPSIIPSKRYIIFLVIAFLSPCFLIAHDQEQLRVISSTSERLVLEYSPKFLGFDTIATDYGTLTLRPKIADCNIAHASAGAPISLVFSTIAAVPAADGFQISSIEAKDVRRWYAIMSPMPTMLRFGEFSETKYNVNHTLYASTSLPSWVKATYGGIARSVRTADIAFTAARFDASSQSIEIPRKIRLTLSFSQGQNLQKPIISLSEIPIAIVNPLQAVQWSVYSSATLSKKAENHIAENRSYAKITIESEGIYRLTADDLAKVGITNSAANASTIKLFGTGGLPMSETVPENYTAEVAEQPIIVRTNNDGSIQDILFYASGASGFERRGADFRHIINYYSNTNSYIITVSGVPGLRAAPLEIPNEIPTARLSSFQSRLFNEEEIFNAYDRTGFGSGTEWFGRKIDGSITFITPLPGLIRQDNVYYRYSIAHRNADNGVCTASENGNILGKLSIQGIGTSSGGSYVEAISSNRIDSISAQALSNDNRSILKFTYTNQSGTVASEAYFDWFEIAYPRECIANNGELELFSDPNINGVAEYSINGFGQQIYGFDVTERNHPKLLQNTSNTGGIFILKSTFLKDNPKRFYFASTFKTPIIEKTEFASLTSSFGNTDIIIITHKDLLESANKYKEYRASAGLSATIVTTDQIYNEFAAGIKDISAIRNFVGYALQNWDHKPRFLVLWGDGHYDFKNISTQQPNYIPTHQQISTTSSSSTFTYDGTQTIAGDDYFARAVGNDSKIDIAIGRLPISTPDVGFSFLDKLKLYESNPEPGEWQQTITLIADDGPTADGRDDGTEHSANSEIISQRSIPDDIFQRKIYMAEYTVENLPGGRRKPGVARDYLNMANNRGTLLMNYVGHGSPRVWAHELIFERETTVPQFVNLKKLFFLTAPTCDFGRFDDPSRNSGSEDLLFSKIGGAIGVFAATRPVYSSPNLNITLSLYKQIFSRTSGRYPTIGEALYQVKQTLYENNDQKFVLLADPTMRILLPDYIVSIDSINGNAVVEDTASMPMIKALSKVTLQATIRRASNNNAIDNSFNGRALITVTDCDVADQVTDVSDGVVHTILRPSGILNHSSYPISNGKFSAEFIVPKDISFSNKQGHLFAFAVDSQRTAKGDTRSFRVGGIESEKFSDILGPDIALYLDARTFRPGELVRKSPLLIVDLYDETGINTTGMGIGHKIEAWIDNNSNSIDLTDDFQSSIEDSRKGSVEKQIFNLSPGNHILRVRAWDVLNNYSETQTYFRTGDDKTVYIYDAIAYPNPTNSSTNLTFIHNQSQPFNAEFTIFAADGRLVRRMSVVISQLHTGSIEWDCKNDAGEPVAQGAYTYIAVINTDNNKTNSIGGMIQVYR